MLSKVGLIQTHQNVLTEGCIQTPIAGHATKALRAIPEEHANDIRPRSKALPTSLSSHFFACEDLEAEVAFSPTGSGERALLAERGGHC